MKTKLSLLCAALLLLAFAAEGHAATALPLDPYPYYRALGQPPGQTYGIAGLYRIDSTQTPNPFQGATLVGANPNVNNAFPGGIGVYSPDTGDFGIGLYNTGAATKSTGLYIQFDQLVSSNGLTVSLGNFGLDSFAAGFDAGHVAPLISIHGDGGLILGTFDAQAILANNAMSLLTSGNPIDPSYNSIFQVDTWKLNLDALVGPLAQVKSFALAADTRNGAGLNMTSRSDPYYLIAVNSCACAPIPEPGSALLILTCGLGVMIIRRRRL